MKIKLRYLVAAPFLAFSGYLLFDSVRMMGTTLKKDWGSVAFVLLFTAIMVGIAAAPGVLALKRRWEDFVKIIAFVVLLILFGQLAGQTNRLNKAVEAICDRQYPWLSVAWGLSVTVAPFVITIAAYNRLVPLIIRRIQRDGDKEA